MEEKKNVHIRNKTIRFFKKFYRNHRLMGKNLYVVFDNERMNIPKFWSRYLDEAIQYANLL